MKDIENRKDLEIIMKQFYTKLLQDERISYIFTDIAKINLEEHLPVLADFWEKSMFYTGDYKNNPMRIHLELNEKEPLTREHFDIWLGHFYNTIDELHTGENAEMMKTRALSIATIMQIKMANGN